MSKTVLTGVVLFVIGIVVGRASVLITQPATSTSAATPTPSTPAPSSFAQPGAPFHGRIAEVLQVPQYTYLRFESGEWAAVDSAPQLKVGDAVTLDLQNEMTDFSSPSLNRTFAKLWFASIQGAAPVARTPSPAEPAPSLPPSGAVQGALDAVANSEAVAMRVGDVFAARDALSGHRVKITAKVDRVNVVQGVNYVHLKDGSGSAADKTDDLLAVSESAVTAGDSVTLEGVIALDQNVGMGTNPVVLTRARLSK
ncbi:MAG: hypothetical protein QM817_01105 [Archangium sp.]